MYSTNFDTGPVEVCRADQTGDSCFNCMVTVTNCFEKQTEFSVRMNLFFLCLLQKTELESVEGGRKMFS